MYNLSTSTTPYTSRMRTWTIAHIIFGIFEIDYFRKHGLKALSTTTEKFAEVYDAVHLQDVVVDND